MNKFFIVNVEAAIYKHDKWLIIKRSENEENAPGTLSLVGGKVELKENTTDVINNILGKTLKREILEEVGIEVDDKMIYLESKYFMSDTNEPVVDVVFLCKYMSGIAICNDKDEVGEVYWKTIEDILNDKDAPEYLKDSLLIAEKTRKNYKKKIKVPPIELQ